MQLARNQHGDLIDACNAGRGWYRCPTCSADVTLKRGPKNVPHFAHVDHVGTPECDLFHPSFGSPISHHQASISLEPIDLSPWTKARLVLSSGSPAFSLDIQLPAHLADGMPWAGYVTYEDRRGLQRSGASDFEKQKLVNVLPQRDPYSFYKKGEVNSTIWSAMSTAIQGLSDKTIFRYSEAAGRRLENREPMELGGRYWLLTLASEILDESISRLTRRAGLLDAWTVYEVNMPSQEVYEGWIVARREYLEDWFGRPFRKPRISLWVTDPLPIFYEGESWVYPFSTAIEITATGPLLEMPAVRDSEQKTITGEILSPSSKWRYKGVKPGRYSVTLGRRMAMTFRVADSAPPLFQPMPLTVSVDGNQMPLFSSASRLHELRSKKQSAALEILFPIGLPKGALTINGAEWSASHALQILDEGKGIRLDADAYGCQVLAPAVQSGAVQVIPRHTVAIKNWLLALPLPDASELRVRFPLSTQELPCEFSLLRDREWSVRYEPHLLNLWHSLKGGSSR